MLVNLNGISQDILTLVLELCDGLVKGLIDPLSALSQDAIKTDQVRRLDTAPNELIYYMTEIKRRAIFVRGNRNVTALVNLKVSGSPTIDAVQFRTFLHVPMLHSEVTLPL